MTGEGSAAASPLVQTTLLGELLENAQVGALAIESGRYVVANAFACEVTGYDRVELIGKGVAELSAPDVAAEETIETRLRERGVGVVQLCRKDGERVEVIFRVTQTSLGGVPLTLALFALF